MAMGMILEMVNVIVLVVVTARSALEMVMAMQIVVVIASLAISERRIANLCAVISFLCLNVPPS